MLGVRDRMCPTCRARTEVWALVEPRPGVPKERGSGSTQRSEISSRWEPATQEVPVSLHEPRQIAFASASDGRCLRRRGSHRQATTQTHPSKAFAAARYGDDSDSARGQGGCRQSRARSVGLECFLSSGQALHRTESVPRRASRRVRARHRLRSALRRASGPAWSVAFERRAS